MQFSGLPIELSKLVKAAKNFKKKHKKVFDVILYGSTTLGKELPNDFDFMVITKKANEEERFDLAFEFREILLDLGFSHEKLDVKAINLESLWDPNYLATPGIIISGFSLTKGKPIHELMNGESYSLFSINVQRLDRSQRKKFNYALKGRDGSGGILKDLNGVFLAPWVVLIPIENTYKFKEFLDYWIVEYEVYLMYGTKSMMRTIGYLQF
ncbi:nucleotidyltransferase domain-containing protein [Thermococcus barophilus]|uniref:nucleotidyltransferase domain-containing protein n=1 Tax=Thermococcus barophilus TaxID=55802 RepID=UPI00018053B2|nr:nucleotidyltransferase domain-containing protein [Thermococcus barophilus]